MNDILKDDLLNTEYYKKTLCEYNNLKSIIDWGIYKEHRNFRILGQSKINKGIKLIFDKRGSTNIFDCFVHVYNSLNIDDTHTYISFDTEANEEKKKDTTTNKITHNDIKAVDVDFNISGKSLFEILNIDDTTLYDMHYLTRVMHIIPIGQCNNVRFKIVCACINASKCTTYQSFINGAHGLREYLFYDSRIDERDTSHNDHNEQFLSEKTFNSVISHSGNNLGFNYLKSMALLKRKDLFNAEYERLYLQTKQYLDYVNVDNIKTHKYVEDYVLLRHYNEKYTIFKSPMGSGKTTYVKECIYEKYDRILFLSPRQSFARSISSIFDGLHCYLDGTVNNRDVNDYKKVVITLESLKRLNIDTLFDCIVIDESESIFNNFSSSTLNNNVCKIHAHLKRLILNATKIVCMDAFISRRTIDYMMRFEDSKNNLMYVINDNKPDNNITISQCKKIDKLVLENVEKRHNNYVVCSSRKTCEDLHSRATQIESDSICIHGNLTTKQKRDLTTNVNVSWRHKNLFVSPTITVGVDYNEEWFDYVYAVLEPSALARDMHQSIKRIRKIGQQQIYYKLPKAYTLNKMRYTYMPIFFTLDEYRNYIMCNNEYQFNLINDIEDNEELMDIIKIIRDNVNDDQLLEVLLYNLIERYQSDKYYNRVFEDYIDKIGYKRDDVIITTDYKTNIKSSVVDYSYCSLPIESSCNIERLNDLIKTPNNDVTMLQRMTVHKYYFNKIICEPRIEDDGLINPDDPLDRYIDEDICDDKTYLLVDEMFKYYMCNETNKQILMNIKNEYTYDVRNDKEEFIEDMNSRAIKKSKNDVFICGAGMLLIKQICAILHINNFYERCIIHTKYFDLLNEFIKANKAKLDTLFRLNPRYYNGDKINTVKYLKALLTNYNGSTIEEADNKGNHMKKQSYNFIPPHYGATSKDKGYELQTNVLNGV